MDNIISAPSACSIAYEARLTAKEKNTDELLNEMHNNFIEITLKNISDMIEDRAKRGLVCGSYVLHDEDFFVCNDSVKLSAGLIMSNIIRKLKLLGYAVEYFSSYPDMADKWSTNELDYTLNIRWGAA